ncbi:TonB-dependent receptor [Erythrobacter sp. LQ02-29]|uniref:TonB-dependent receptor plug domain-containing protein n=1 Tax=Erythrobacter sp. LQ02-29 TaxID=2920384 RepID=UPI001F4E61DA|nr:TonB-dependent receptor [Erythrobacter sp. LQ02-29]MCP9223814.1 TonB-dependent receptor [Erythrobacter sp. LQ02-29]
MLTFSALAIVLAAPAMAQETAPVAQTDTDGGAPGGAQDDAAEDDTNVIVVTARRLRGEIETDVPPIAELDENDIKATGASSIADLVSTLAPASNSARGRGSGQPVFLINGVRVASFREFRSYPPEAIQKVQVLPEQVAQRYGYSPDQRVINFILKENFSSKEVELEYNQPDRGGNSRNEQELTYLRILENSRLNANLEHTGTSLLTESERDIVQEAGTPAGAGLYRSLVSASDDYEATLNWTKPFESNGASLSLNGTFERSDTRALAGYDAVRYLADGTLRALERDGRSDSYSAAATYTSPLGPFQFTGTVDSTLGNSRTFVDLPGGGRARADSDTFALVSKATAQGNVLLLPAGEVGLTLDGGYKYNRIDSTDTRTQTDTELDRSRLSASTTLVVPLTSRREEFADGLGDFSLNLQGGVDRLSDFGTLTEWSAGLNWNPTERLSLQATYIRNQEAPSLTQLGAPQITEFSQPYFDVTTGQTVLVDVLTGGNPNLLAETQNDWKFSVNWRLPTIAESRINVDYVRNRSSDVTASFPQLTPAIEAAFPGRITRAADGTLVAIDARPVTFAETRADRLSIGFFINGAIGSKPDQPEGEGGGRRGGGNPFGRGNDPRPRYFLSLSHNIELNNEILIAPGVPILDQLDGDATASLGLPRNTSQLEAGLFFQGYGVRVSGRYTGSAFVGGSTLPGSTDLFIDDLATVDLRLFANLGEITGKDEGFLKNLRVSLRADNLFDGQRVVRDSTGVIPLRYQPLRLDPNGRYLGIELRKVF